MWPEVASVRAERSRWRRADTTSVAVEVRPGELGRKKGSTPRFAQYRYRYRRVKPLVRFVENTSKQPARISHQCQMSSQVKSMHFTCSLSSLSNLSPDFTRLSRLVSVEVSAHALRSPGLGRSSSRRRLCSRKNHGNCHALVRLKIIQKAELCRESLCLCFDSYAN